MFIYYSTSKYRGIDLHNNFLSINLLWKLLTLKFTIKLILQNVLCLNKALAIKIFSSVTIVIQNNV